MTKKRAGIFDPWRQERPAPVVTPRPIRSEDTLDGAAFQPVRFAGKRGGLTVWLSGGDAELILKQAQTNVLAALLHLMSNKKLHPIFINWGIMGKEHTEGSAPRTVMSDGTRMVVVLGEYEKAMDAIAFALREATRLDPKIGEYLLSMGIRPYIV